ncbi:hypothetical protein CPL00367_CDS0059 [Klebsiella phage HelplessSquare]
MIDCDCFILCNVMMECFMMCNELHRCMHYAHNSPFESCQNVPCVSPTFASCGNVGEEKSYRKVEQKVTNISL